MKSSNKESSRRFDYLDNLKIMLTILVILHHVAALTGLDKIGFNLPRVILENQWQYDILNNFLGINQSYFMSLFFFISALFVIPSLKRKGAIAFTLNKLKRLGIPILIWLFILLPLLSIQAAKINFINFFSAANIDLGVTWFCWALIIFNVTWLLVTLPKKHGYVIQQKTIPTLTYMVLFAIIMIPCNYIFFRLQQIVGDNFFGFHFLKYFPMYIASFWIGVSAYQHQWIEQLEYRHACFGILIWLTSKAFFIPIFNGFNLPGEVLFRGFTVIGMSLFLVYSFQKMFDYKNKVTITLSRISFAAYAFQIPILFLLAKAYTPIMTQVPLFNFILIGLLGNILSFALAYVICKLPILSSIF